MSVKRILRILIILCMTIALTRHTLAFSCTRCATFLIRNKLFKTKRMKRMAINPQSKSVCQKFTINAASQMPQISGFDCLEIKPFTQLSNECLRRRTLFVPESKILEASFDACRASHVEALQSLFRLDDEF